MSNSNSNNTDEAVEAVAETFKKVEAGVSELFEGVDMAVPEAVRAIAEKTVTQSREAYETVKDTMEEAVEVLEKSVDQASQGAAALNRKVIDNAQTNLNTSFDLAKDLASAKNIAEIMELQASYARKQFEVLTAQAEEIRTLSTKITTDTTNPLKDHVSQSIDKVMAS